MSGILQALLASRSGGGGASYTVILTFNSTSSWTAPTGVTSINYLCVAGGAGGGCTGGGGGAGGYLTGTSLSVTPGTTYAITVGSGGTGSTVATSSGGNGTASLIGTLVNGSTGSVGGGGGGSNNSGAPAVVGGSGGGGWYTGTSGSGTRVIIQLQHLAHQQGEVVELAQSVAMVLVAQQQVTVVRAVIQL